MLQYKTVDSPIGRLRLIAGDKGLRAVLFNDGEQSKLVFDEMAEAPEDNATLAKAELQLKEYFAGDRQRFEVKLDMRGTVFQLMAWKQLQKIPYGGTISYAEQARNVGDANKARAVGMANNRNPLPVIVPCHRVVGADGKLVGFGGGLPVKEFLLKLEKTVADSKRPLAKHA